MTSTMTARWTQFEPGSDLARIWDEVADRDPSATFFHTRAWAEMLVRTLPGHTIATMVFQREDGKRAVMPAIRRPAAYGVFGVLTSMLPEVYGGPICECEDEAGLTAILDLSRRKAQEITVIGNPYGSWTFPESFGQRDVTTHVIDLAEDEDELWAKVQSGWRRKIRRAEREGVTFEPATSAADVADYYDAYERSRARWGASAMAVYPRSLFEKIVTLPEESARLWVARHGGRIVGGMVVFYHNRHAVYWHGAAVEEGLLLGASNFLMWRSILDARRRGHEIFDMNPSAGLEGVIAFKEGFGPSLRTFQRGVARRPLFSLAKSLKGRLT